MAKKIREVYKKYDQFFFSEEDGLSIRIMFAVYNAAVFASSAMMLRIFLEL